MSRPKKYATDADRYEAHKRRNTARANAVAAAGRDIGPLPKVKNPARKRAAGKSLSKFGATYFKEAVSVKLSQAHVRMIERIESAVLRGELYSMALPRGSGKSTWCKIAILWAVLYGHHRYVVLLAASADVANERLTEIKTMLETNELLYADFPEAVHPIRKLENVIHRQKGQTLDHRPTRLEFSGDKLVLAEIPKKQCSGAVISTCGLRGGDIRGQTHTLADGTILRPTLFLGDDIQTRESAASPSQCRMRLRVVRSDVMRMAGPLAKMAGLMALTIIYPDDVADQLTNRDLHPEWHGTRVAMMTSEPKNIELWHKYHEVKKAEQRAERDNAESNAFYAANRAAMDDGCTVYWQERITPGCLSAIQSAMDIFLEDPDGFAAECQNQPKARTEQVHPLTKEDIVSRKNGLPRAAVPANAANLVAHVDVQGDLLYYAVLASAKDATPVVVDYGSFPEQPSRDFTLATARNRLSDRYPGLGEEQRILRGLEDVLTDLLAREYRQDGTGNQVPLTFIGVDANYGVSTELVYMLARREAFKDRVYPMHGRFFGAVTRPMAEQRVHKGDRRGDHWKIPARSKERPQPYVVFDTNYWKKYMTERVQTELGEAGAFTMYGGPRDNHNTFADHVLSEIPVEVVSGGRTVYEFRLLPNRDNHWFDNVVSCLVLCSMAGCALPSTPTGHVVSRIDKKPKISLQELQRQKKHEAR